MRDIKPIWIAVAALVALALIIFALRTNRNPDQDKLKDFAAEQAPLTAAEKRCSSKATYDRIKRELFRRAAEVRGSDHAAFDQVGAAASLRMENPVLEREDTATGKLDCSATAFLDLPPGVQVVGGRRSLSANLDYSIQGAADGSGDVLDLRNAEGIVTPLATMSRVVEAPAMPTVEDDADANAIVDPLAPQQSPESPQPPAPAASARPSFNCANARTSSEHAVCRDPGLAALDRQMAAQFAGAVSRATPPQRALLQQTRDRFLAFRDTCRSDVCIGDAYRGRMREINDIMTGRWRPSN